MNLKINHITINMKNENASIRFYTEFLGLDRLEDVVMPDHRLIYYQLSNSIRLELIEYFFPVSTEKSDLTRKGIFRHLAFEVSDIESFAKNVEKYGGVITQPPRRIDALGFIGMLILDPNGCELEFVECIS